MPPPTHVAPSCTPLSPLSERSPRNSLDKYICTPTSPISSPGVQSPVGTKLECDYDVNPTALYEAIQDKQWDYAINLQKKVENVEDQARTWVVRKERNGKLRWRLLPLHAAVIFGSPVKLIERLLVWYPEAACCKDDQGMLPLHLSFRNESTWDIADELLTAYPQAIFISDRKGRTPLQCAIQMVSSSNSVSSFDPSRPESKTFRSVVNVLDMYSQIVAAAERKNVQSQARKAAEARIAKLQDSHLTTLANLKKEWQSQQQDSKRQMAKLKEQNKLYQDKVQTQITESVEAKSTEEELREEIRQLKLALSEATHEQKKKMALHHMPPPKRSSSTSAPRQDMGDLHRTNGILRTMMEDMVAEQRAYQTQFHDLMSKYEKLVEERKQLEQIFVTKTHEQHKKEVLVVEKFKGWMKEREKSLEENSVYLEDDTSTSLEEEKKIEDPDDFAKKDVGDIPTMTRKPGPPPPSIALSDPRSNDAVAASGVRAAPIIDLSNMASPREEYGDDEIIVGRSSGSDDVFTYTPSMD